MVDLNILTANAPELTNLIGKFIYIMYNAIGNYGWTVVVFTIILKVILSPLDFWQKHVTRKNNKAMKKMAPELEKLKKQFGSDPRALQQKQMALYKKNKISPFGSIIVMIVQFPIFICVWGALSGSSALSTGTFYNMNLSQTVWEALNNTAGLPGNVNGWWTAFVLIILMTLFQVAATIVPMLIQRAQRKKVEKTGKNNAVAKQNKTMKIVQFVMLAMIIFMGFTLPSAMGVYWIAGAIFSLAQTLIMHFVTNRKGKKSEPKHKEPKNKENIGDKVVLEAAPIEVIEETSSTNETPKQNKNNKKKNNYKEFKYPKKRGGRR